VHEGITGKGKGNRQDAAVKMDSSIAVFKQNIRDLLEDVATI
jgi:hypothetical protein